MDHIHGSYESTNRFRINPFSRAVINESEVEIVIAQYDHNSERFIFELPKMVEEHDMTLCSAIRIHYINAGSNNKVNKDVYIVDDLKISDDDPDTITFSWPLSKSATSINGVLSFAIEFVCTTDGKVDYSWSTLPSESIKISETYNISDNVIDEDYSDILELWKEELFSQFMEEGFDLSDYYDKEETDAKLATKADEMAGMQKISLVGISSLDRDFRDVEYISEDSFYLTLGGTLTVDFQGYVRFRMLTTYNGNTIFVDGVEVDANPYFGEDFILEYNGFVNDNIQIKCNAGCDHTVEFYGIPNAASKEEINANALIASASGEVIRVDDVSASAHKTVASVSGKNLAVRRNSQTTFATEGITYTVNEDGTITANGTATGTAYYLMLGNTNYESQVPIKKGRYTIGMAPAQGCRISVGIRNNENDVRILYYSTHTNVISFDITTDTARFDMILCVDTGAKVENVIFKPMLEEGPIATEYKPYINPTSVKITRCGKNLFPSLNPTSKDGITLSKVDDYYTLNGTATNSGLITTTVGLPSGRYTISANNPAHNGLDLAIVQVYSDTTKKSLVAKDNAPYSTYTDDVLAANDYQFRIRYKKGVTYNNYIVKPQLELGTEATDYEANIDRTTYTPSTDGTVEIDSISPTMTVFTDISGVNIDLEYQQDHNKAMNDVRSDIATLDNSVATLATSVGNFDAALDAAIALCDSYIGGES